MSNVYSPLRYPGGKAVLSHFLSAVMKENGLQNGIYVEPYAGGAGAALNLLFSKEIERILINDVDDRIFAFWHSVLNQTKRFLRMLDQTPITIDEWKRQRMIYLKPKPHSQIKVGFATFYLNRCNRSGILRYGGPIGGIKQSGKWKLNARYNKEELTQRIKKIISYKRKIQVFNMDAIEFLRQEVVNNIDDHCLVFLDPPYYIKGARLYLNYYEHKDHVKLSKFLKKQKCFQWIVSYDNVQQIRKLYSGMKQISFDLRYSVHTSKYGSELLIHDKSLILPKNLWPITQSA